MSRPIPSATHQGSPSAMIVVHRTGEPPAATGADQVGRPAADVTAPHPASAKIRNPHRPTPARRGFVPPRLSYTFGARNSWEPGLSGFRRERREARHLPGARLSRRRTDANHFGDDCKRPLSIPLPHQVEQCRCSLPSNVRSGPNKGRLLCASRDQFAFAQQHPVRARIQRRLTS